MRLFIIAGLMLSLVVGRLLGSPPDKVDSMFEDAVRLNLEEKYQESFGAFEALKKILIEKNDTARPAFALSFLLQGEIAFFQFNAADSATALFHRGMAHCKQFGHKTRLVATAGNLMGYYYLYQRSNLEQAHEALQNALLLFPKDSTPNRNLIACYKRQGSVYARKGDFEQAISYYQRGIALRESAGNPPELNNVGIRHDLAISYEFVGRDEDAKALYIELVKDIGPQSGREEYALNGLAGIYIKEADFQKARATALKAISMVLKRTDGDSANHIVANSISQLGDIALAKGDIAEGIHYYEKVLDLYSRAGLFGPRHRATAKVMFTVADLYSRAGKDSLALDMHQKALATFIPYFKPETVTELPVIRADDKEVWIVSSLKEKARLFLLQYRKTGEQEWARLALEHVSLSIKQQEKVVFHLSHRESNAQLIEEDYAIYQYGLEACFALYHDNGQHQYLERAFQIMEKGKAMLLHKNAALGNFSEAIAVRTKADSLKQQIAQLRIKSKEGKSTQESDELLAQLEVEADLLRASSKNDPVAAAILLRESAQRLLEQVQAEVLSNPGQGLLHFFVADEAIYCLFVQKESVSFSKETLDSSLIRTLDAFRKSVSQAPDSRNAKAAFQSFKQHAYQLYIRLLQKSIEQAPQLSHIIIIPHGQLSTIPFESLITDLPEQANSYQQLPYLLRSKTISYAYSATSLLDYSKGQIPNGALAIAPSFASREMMASRIVVDSVRGNLSELEWTSEEAKKVHAIHGGILLLGDKASEAVFKANCGQNGIIHIASHALLHEEEPALSRILFSTDMDSSEDGSLFLEEIFSMNFDNKLICLSACNTAWGKLTRSDGLLSLARGFHYAGSPSLMATLWQAHDRSSYLISTNFHQELHDGKYLDEAMQQAKLSYLKDADALKAHPYYWAHMLVIGDTRLQFTSSDYKKRGLGVLLFLIFVASFSLFLNKEAV